MNGIDLGILAGNFFNTNMNWTQGDFNGDGVVNGIDLALWQPTSSARSARST